MVRLSVFEKPYVLSCRMNDEKFECLKYTGSMSETKRSKSRTSTAVPSADQLKMSIVEASETIVNSLCTKGLGSLTSDIRGEDSKRISARRT